MRLSRVHMHSRAAPVLRHPVFAGLLCIVSAALSVLGLYLLNAGSWTGSIAAIVLAMGLCDVVTWAAMPHHADKSDSTSNAELLARYPALFAKTSRLAFWGFLPLFAIVTLWMLAPHWGWLPAAIGTAILLPLWLVGFVIPFRRLRYKPLA